MPINFDSSRSYNDNYDGANISISKKTGTRSVDNKRDQLALDQITKSSSDYQEEYIPPVDNPQLGAPNPNADKKTPKTAPSPQNAFLKKTQDLIAKVTPEQLSAFPGAAKEEVQAKLLFALNHPGVPVDANTQALIKQMKNQAESATQRQLKLPESWQPSVPNAQKADKAIADFAGATFENLVNSQLPEDEANKLIFQYYHPEFANEGDSSKLASFKNKAYQETAIKEGLPEGWEIKPDSSAYDSMVNSAYDEAFTSHLNSNPSTKDLSANEKAQLETLHQFPDADVPDKAKLQKFLSQLENEALKDTAKEFNLPKEFKPGTNYKEYASTLLGEYQSKFEGNVKNQQPPLSRAQQNKLLATGGVNSKNLSPEQEAIFNQIKDKTADDVAEMYGLPKNWLKIKKDKASVEIERQSKKDEEEDGKSLEGEVRNPNESNSTEAENVGLGALSFIVGSRLGRKSLNETLKLEGTASISSNKNHEAALNAINFFDDGARIYDNWITKLSSSEGVDVDRFNLSSDWMLAGDFTFAVTKALDKVRRSVYQIQFAEAQMSKKTALMTTENQKTQTLVNEAVRKNAEAQNKAEQKKNVFAALENAPGIAGILGKAFASWLKLQFWVLDTILGGAISSICQACGCQSMSANPLEMLGLISHEVAAEMDRVLQIIIMVVQIVVELLLAQPQLVAASIASITKAAGELAAQVALKTVVKQVVQNAVKVGMKQAASEAAEALGKETIKEIATQIVSKAGKALSKTAQKQLTKAIEKGLTKNADKIVKRAAKEAGKLVEEYGDEAVKHATRSLKTTTDDVINEATQLGFKESLKKLTASSLKGFDKIKFQAENFARDLGDMLISKASEIKDGFLNIGKKVKEAALQKLLDLSAKVGDSAGYVRHDRWMQAFGQSLYTEAEITRMVGRASVNARMAITGVTTISRAYQAASFVGDAASGSLQIASGVVNGMKNLNLARLKMEMGRYEAALAELDANLKVMKQLQRALLDSLSNLAGWINDVNKQEGDFYKKSQIHFIAA